MDSLVVPRHAQVSREHVQGTAAATAAAVATSVSAGKYDGTIYDAKPNGPAAHDDADNDGCTGPDANDAAADDDGTATADDSADGADATHGTATTVGPTEYAAVGPASTALCWIWNEITHLEDILTVRGRRTGSF